MTFSSLEPNYVLEASLQGMLPSAALFGLMGKGFIGMASYTQEGGVFARLSSDPSYIY